MFEIDIHFKISKMTIDRLSKLVIYYNENERDPDDETEYNNSQIIRIAINRLYNEKIGR